MKAKNLRIQKLCDAGTEMLYIRDIAPSPLQPLEEVKTSKNYSSIKFLFGGLLTNIPHSNYSC